MLTTYQPPTNHLPTTYSTNQLLTTYLLLFYRHLVQYVSFYIGVVNVLSLESDSCQFCFYFGRQNSAICWMISLVVSGSICWRPCESPFHCLGPKGWVSLWIRWVTEDFWHLVMGRSTCPRNIQGYQNFKPSKLVIELHCKNKSGRLSTYRTPTDHQPTTYWPPASHLPTDHPLATYRPPTYWPPPTDHLPTTYRPWVHMHTVI